MGIAMSEVQLTKAVIYSCDGDGNIDGKIKFSVQFNPNELTITEAVGEYNYDSPTAIENNQKPGSQNDVTKSLASLLQAQNKKNKSKTRLSFTLFYNTYNEVEQTSYKDVRDEIKQFYPFLNQDKKNKDSLIKIGFGWGSIQMAGVLTSMDTKYKMFAPSGTPVRAEVSIAIEGEYKEGINKVKGNNEKIAELNMSKSLSQAMKGTVDPTNWRSFAVAASIAKARLSI